MGIYLCITNLSITDGNRTRFAQLDGENAFVTIGGTIHNPGGKYHGYQLMGETAILVQGRSPAAAWVDAINGNGAQLFPAVGSMPIIYWHDETTWSHPDFDAEGQAGVLSYRGYIRTSNWLVVIAARSLVASRQIEPFAVAWGDLLYPVDRSGAFIGPTPPPGIRFDAIVARAK